MKVKLSTFSLSELKAKENFSVQTMSGNCRLCPATFDIIVNVHWMNFFLIFSSSFQKVQPKCASEKKDFRLSIKRKQSCQVKKKRRVFNAIKKTFYSKKPIVFAKHMIWCWKTFLRIYHNYYNSCLAYYMQDIY